MTGVWLLTEELYVTDGVILQVKHVLPWYLVEVRIIIPYHILRKITLVLTTAVVPVVVVG